MVRSLLLTGCVALFCVAGCIDFEYVGREFEPTPISDPVTYYVNREQLPPGEFRIMGRAEISAPDGTDGYDIQELRGPLHGGYEDPAQGKHLGYQGPHHPY